MPTTFGNETKSTFLKHESHKLHEELVVAPRTGAITLDADLITANSIIATVNGATPTATVFGTDHATTMLAFAAKLQALSTVKTATVTAARVITIVAEDQENAPAITNAAVTLGATQATVTTSTTDRTIHAGQPVKLTTAGEVEPLTAGDAPHLCIGVAVNESENPEESGDRVTIAMRAFIQTFAVASGAVVPGPVKYDGYDAVNGYNKYSSGSVTQANCVGWSLEAGADTDEIVVALMD
jgi:hypothetical protein